MPFKDILAASYRDSAQCQYRTCFRRWIAFCCEREADPRTVSIELVLEFLTSLFQAGLQYSAITTARFILYSFSYVDNMPVGQLPLVGRFLKGVFNLRPALPRNKVVSDADTVSACLRSLSPVRKLSSKFFTLKLVMLIALLVGQRRQTLHLIDLRNTTVSIKNQVW